MPRGKSAFGFRPNATFFFRGTELIGTICKVDKCFFGCFPWNEKSCGERRNAERKGKEKKESKIRWRVEDEKKKREMVDGLGGDCCLIDKASTEHNKAQKVLASFLQTQSLWKEKYQNINSSLWYLLSFCFREVWGVIQAFSALPITLSQYFLPLTAWS